MFSRPRLCTLLVCLGLAAGSSAASSLDRVAAESARANELFERAFQDRVDRSPEFQTALGLKTNYGRWDDRSDARAIEDAERALRFLSELKRTVDYRLLDDPTRLSYRLFEYDAERTAQGVRFRHNGYVISQTGGRLTGMTNLLVTTHRIDSKSDAEAYVERLRGFAPALDQVVDELKLQRSRGVVPPRWVFPKAAEVARNIVSGAPFSDTGADSPLWADFKAKVANLADVDEPTRAALRREAQAALVEAVRPAVERVLASWSELERVATDDDGVWKFADGRAYYNFRLEASTTTSLTADEIHRIGLDEVARIQDEMRTVMTRVGFTGDLQAFFRFVREDPQFYLPNTPEGRQTYLDRATAVADDMKARLDTLFLRKPKADLVVKATEPYREKTASKAFYQRPAPNGTRPGMYYVTLYNMREMPTYQLEAIAYHEGVPGHHMQIAIAQELENVPRFRRFGGQIAYIEGWGLYCELLPKEIGLYQDPYSDFGRLAMELWRAVRLVVDTGIHAKRWTRQQAVDYFVNNNPLSEAEAVREIERYIMNPGQATSYKIGMLRILELRDYARKALGSTFDLREFHDVILRDGPLPLDVLEEQVNAWVAAKQT
jgi:uncharacterized protein (DUF885 family)